MEISRIALPAVFGIQQSSREQQGALVPEPAGWVGNPKFSPSYFAVDLHWGSPRVSQSSRLLSKGSWLLSRYRTESTKIEEFTPRAAQNTKNYRNRSNNGGER